ncbi:MAG TPA: PAS domain S-box protein [Candidatus Deferrimicrobiaceae bacterium]
MEAVIALFCASASLQFLAAWLSFRFVYHKRLGPHWSFVTFALLVMGGLRTWAIVLLARDGFAGEGEFTLPSVELLVSLFLAVGFLLTERWFLLKERLENRFRIMSSVDQAVIGVLEEDRILSLVCEGLAGGRGYPLAWIGVGEPDGTVRVARSEGPAKGFLTEVSIRWDDSPEGRGPTGRAIRSGAPSVANRIRGDLDLVSWRAAFERHELRSAASFPIRRKGLPPLALTLYGRTKDAFDRLEIEALKAMASRVETAIQSARRHEMFVSAKNSYDDLLRMQRDGVILVRGGRIVRVNPAAAAMLGYSSTKELSGEDVACLYPPQDREERLARMDRDAGEDVGEEARDTPILRKDGSVIPCEVTVTWVPRGSRNEDYEPLLKGPLGMILLRDVTQRKRVLEDLRAERDFSSKILDVAGVLVMQLGPGNEILLFNRQCEEATGYSAGELLGQSAIERLVPEGSRPDVARTYRELWNGREHPSTEHPLLGKGGDARLIAWNYAVLPDAGGTPASVIAAGIDVTERRFLERQIVAMQKLEAVGTLAGGVAHDFNNILTGILGNLELARRSLEPGSPALAPVGESIHASERAAQLVRQLLEFSRRSPVERSVVDVGAVVGEVVHLFSQTIDRRIGVEMSVPDGLWHAAADSGQLHQVLMNLCINARDAVLERLETERPGSAAPNGFRVRVSVENATVGEEYCRVFPYARPGEFSVLSVSDDGAGMDAETQRRVFEPFFTTKKMGRGTGLGLSTVFGIVKQHAGWINLESRKGRGSTFRVYIPRAVDSGVMKEPAPEPVPLSRGRETILLADDERMIRDLGKQVLEMQGYTVVTAADGQQAIDRYVHHQDRIDLVILDLTMPHLSGLEVMERIRNLDAGAKVILSSGYRSEDADAAVRISKAYAFLPKPYRPDLLSKTVREVLDRGNP